VELMPTSSCWSSVPAVFSFVMRVMVPHHTDRMAEISM
jgi:hypothetical protein